jgi:hypothetical protein
MGALMIQFVCTFTESTLSCATELQDTYNTRPALSVSLERKITPTIGILPNPLKDAHASLDSAVLTAYGFDPRKDILSRLLTSNGKITVKIQKHEPVTPPGTSPNCSHPDFPLTKDCVKSTIP